MTRRAQPKGYEGADAAADAEAAALLVGGVDGRGRPAYIGAGDEPLFLTDDGREFSREGWAAMAQRLRRQIAREGIPFKQHRLRSTCARRLHEAGYQDTAIMEILGWSSVAMLRRYLGKIPVAQLKRLPTTLERVFGRAV